MDTYQTYKAVFEASPDAIIIVGDSGQITLVNNQAVKLFGFTEEEMLGKAIELVIPDRFHKIHRNERKEYTAHPVARGMGPELNIIGKRKDGSEFPVEISLSPINLKGSTYIAAAIRDVTARKEIEKKLLESEKKYHSILDNMLEAVVIFDFNFRYLYINNAGVKQTKSPREKILGHTFLEMFPGSEETEVFKAFQQGIIERVTTKSDFEFTFSDNSKGWFEISIQPVPEGIFVLSIDITERKNAEEKVKASEHMLAESQKVAHIGSWEWDIVADKVTWSDEMYRMYGFQPHQFEARFANFLKNIHDDDRERVNNIVQQAYKNHKEYNVSFRIVRPDGNIRVMHSWGNVIVDKNNQPVKMRGVAVDITERKKAEEEIINQKEFIEAILTNLPADIAVFNSNHQYIFLNPNAISDAATRKWMIGKDDFDYCRYKGTDDAIAHRRRKFFKEAVHTKARVQWIDEHITKQGNTVYILRNFYPVFQDGRLSYMIGYGIDLTTFKETEIKLQEAILATQKAYKELEQFSYMVSHDLQEPLRMVRGFLDLLKSETEELLDDSAKEYIFYATDGAERMKTLIHDLLQYSRVGTNKEDFTDIDLNELLKGVKHVLLQNNENIEAHITINTLPIVKGNKTLLYQLFLNLIGNALKYHKKNTDPEVEVGYTEEANTYTFYVKDNGIGIDPASFEKIFVIFHRLHSRTEYSGTGIGLAICKKIVQTQGGTIWVESEVGSGSTFYFTILKNPLF